VPWARYPFSQAGEKGEGEGEGEEGEEEEEEEEEEPPGQAEERIGCLFKMTTVTNIAQGVLPFRKSSPYSKKKHPLDPPITCPYGY